MNFYLGENYSLITKEKNKEEFEHARESMNFADCIYAFLTDSNAKMHQLSDKQKSFIMTKEGKTFANVSFH